VNDILIDLLVCDAKLPRSMAGNGTFNDDKENDTSTDVTKIFPKSTESSVMVDWNLADSFAVEWNDGHIPESFMLQNNTHCSSSAISTQQYMRIYPKYHHYPRCCYGFHKNNVSDEVNTSSSPFVYCADDTMPVDLTDEVYRYTVETNQPHTTWGSYVTMKQIQQYWDTHSNSTSCSSGNPDGDQLDRIAIPAAAWFIRNYISASNGGNPNLIRNSYSGKNSIEVDCDASKFFDNAHGVAVWALASDIGSHVPYHLDYAELLRYETGVLVPPILAGTWHGSRHHRDMFSGGDYCVAVRGNGLDHYYRHGYKGKLQPVVGMNDEMPLHDGNASIDDKELSNFLRIPYRFNRMICQSGHLPHWSTRVEAPAIISNVTSLRTEEDFVDTASSSIGNLKTTQRVVVGFNVFLHDVGPVIQQAPEHSEAFRSRVQQQRQNRVAKSKTLSLEAVASNPRLRRLLVLAKREKCKNDFKFAQNELDLKIQKYLEDKNDVVSVQELLDAFNPTHPPIEWPYNVNDVHVYIHSCWKRGRFRVVAGNEKDEERTTLISMDWLISRAM
jgi:hypothetical protein